MYKISGSEQICVMKKSGRMYLAELISTSSHEFDPAPSVNENVDDNASDGVTCDGPRTTTNFTFQVKK